MYTHSQQGYGATQPAIVFYIGNIPAFEGYSPPTTYRGIKPSEIAHIVANTSNHWRKVFNVYAKVMWLWLETCDKEKWQCLHDQGVTRWQIYRDTVLFQEHGNEALIFSPYTPTQNNALNVLAGKTYGLSQLPHSLFQIDAYFWVNSDKKLVIAPYPDYRQLSDARIEKLVALLQSLAGNSQTQ